MWLSNTGVNVYLCLGTTDMRKSTNGLSIIVSEILEKDPFSGHLFAFCSRNMKIMKVLYWDRNGFCLWYKRLEKDRFPWPKTQKDLLEISSQQFRWLLDGIDINQSKAYSPVKYNCLY